MRGSVFKVESYGQFYGFLDFENEPILPEVMLNETSEELVQLPKTTRLTQSEKKLALEG